MVISNKRLNSVATWSLSHVGNDIRDIDFELVAISMELEMLTAKMSDAMWGGPFRHTKWRALPNYAEAHDACDFVETPKENYEGNTMTMKVITGDGMRAEDVSDEMAKRIKALIYEYKGRTTVAAVIGVLTIVQHEVIGEQR